MQQHQQSLSNAVTLIVPCPKACPLAQNVRSPRSASADGLVDPKLDLDHSLVRAADRPHLPGKDDISLIRELMKNVDNCLRLHSRLSRGNLTTGQRSHQRRSHRKRARQFAQDNRRNPPMSSLSPLLVFRHDKAGREQ